MNPLNNHNYLVPPSIPLRTKAAKRDLDSWEKPLPSQKKHPAPTKPLSVFPDYGPDLDNPPDEPIGYQFYPHTDYLKEVFGGNKPITIKPLSTGSCWKVWTCPEHPELVVKTPIGNLAPDSQQKCINDSFEGLENFPKNDLIGLAPLLGDNPEKALQELKLINAIIQVRTNPFTLSNDSEHLPQIANILLAMVKGELPIQDFYPKNVGTYQGKIVHFDPANQKLGKKEWLIELKEYYLYWAGGNKSLSSSKIENVDPSLLSALADPLQAIKDEVTLARSLLDSFKDYYKS